MSPLVSPEIPETNGVSGQLASKSPAVTKAIDDDLQAVIAAWDALPDLIRRGIVAMVRAARGS
jgi:hypothetical protein